MGGVLQFSSKFSDVAGSSAPGTSDIIPQALLLQQTLHEQLQGYDYRGATSGIRGSAGTFSSVSPVKFKIQPVVVSSGNLQSRFNAVSSMSKAKFESAVAHLLPPAQQHLSQKEPCYDVVPEPRGVGMARTGPCKGGAGSETDRKGSTTRPLTSAERAIPTLATFSTIRQVAP